MPWVYLEIQYFKNGGCMGLIAGICTNCGGIIEFDESLKNGFCVYCGTPFIAEQIVNKITQNINIKNAVMQGGPSEANLMVRARQFLEKGDYNRAVEYAENALDINPYNQSAQNIVDGKTDTPYTITLERKNECSLLPGNYSLSINDEASYPFNEGGVVSFKTRSTNNVIQIYPHWIIKAFMSEPTIFFEFFANKNTEIVFYDAAIGYAGCVPIRAWRSNPNGSTMEITELIPIQKKSRSGASKSRRRAR